MMLSQCDLTRPPDESWGGGAGTARMYVSEGPPPPRVPPPWEEEGSEQASASCAELGGAPPLRSAFGEEARVAHDVQTIRMVQAAPATLTQVLRFARLNLTTPLNCSDADVGCVPAARGDDPSRDIVRLVHNGKASTKLDLSSATAAEIRTAFAPLRDTTYSKMLVTEVDVTDESVAWTVELTTPAAACAGGGGGTPPPLLGVARQAKVAVSVTIAQGASCLDGGVDVSSGDGAAVHLPAGADADEATRVINTALGVSAEEATAGDGGVYVTRDGDGHAEVVFTVTSLRAGARPALVVSRSADAPLLRRAFAADYGSSTATEGGASAEVSRVASGAIDLMPLPARYLTAPSESVALSVRLGAQTTARCAAPSWDTLHVGCFEAAALATPYTAHFAGGSSLERCALHRHRNAKRAAAVGFAALKTRARAFPRVGCRRRRARRRLPAAPLPALPLMSARVASCAEHPPPLKWLRWRASTGCPRRFRRTAQSSRAASRSNKG